MRAKRGATDLAGVLVVDKPAGRTSHDVVSALRAATGERRIGHAGTLDPMATGVLLVLVGRATRLEQYLVGHDKRYEARIVFGSATDTLDAEGAVVATQPVPPAVADPAYARDLLQRFEGAQDQMPPAYSAIKRGGQPAHRLARAGVTPDLEPRAITVHHARLLDVDASQSAWDVDFRVSKGTYIRSLAADIASAAGTVGHLGALRRTAIGDVLAADALPLDEVVLAGREGRLSALMTDPVRLLGFPAFSAPPAARRDGRPVPLTVLQPVTGPASALAEGGRLALVHEHELLGVYRVSGPLAVPETIFDPGVHR